MKIQHEESWFVEDVLNADKKKWRKKVKKLLFVKIVEKSLQWNLQWIDRYDVKNARKSIIKSRLKTLWKITEQKM